MNLPTGTVTFLFTDIEGSTRLWEQQPDAMQPALARHDAILRRAIEQHRGHIVKGTGDGLLAVFARASDALSACLSAQLAFQQEEQKEPASIRIRMALHTGSAQERDGDYFGACVNRVARLMSIGHGGQVLLSEVTQNLVKERLPERCRLKDLGKHRLKDLQEAEQVFQLLHPSLRSGFPALKSLDSLPNNLPRQLSSFIGREKQIEEVKQLLLASPLVTLTGTGGSGKTRLALQVAAESLVEYSDGVWLVELAAVADPSLVVQTAAASLGLREAPGPPLLQTLLDYLNSRTLLLVLDNCEHLLQACAVLAHSILRSCPQLRLLVTSREALKVAGEQVYRVPSLSAPDPDQIPTEEKEIAFIVSEYEAPRLFVERARLLKTDFTLTRQNASVVASVCHRLDGIPLAIELAAARVNVLSVEDINVRFKHRFRLLKGGSRTVLPRQQTLQATLDWSYELLSKQEQLLLARLSVFAGGWSLEAAEAVCSEEGIEAPDILDLLISLVEKSLSLAGEREGKSRYRMLETIQDYGLQRLQESGQEKLWRTRHLQFFLMLAEEAEPKLTGAEQGEWLQRLQEEHDNLRAGLQWCQQDKQSQEAGLRLAVSLRWFWQVRGFVSEGRTHLNTILSQENASQPTPTRVKALHSAGNLAVMQGDYAAARALYELSLSMSKELGDKLCIAASLGNLGNVTFAQSDYAAAHALFEESLTIQRELEDKPGIAASLGNLAHMAYSQGDYAAARSLLEESLAIERELGARQGIAYALHELGRLAYDQGDYAAARALYEESVVIKKELEDKRGLVYSLNGLGNVAAELGEYAAAHTFYEQSLTLSKDIEDKQWIAHSLSNLGAMASNLGEYVKARAWQKQGLTILIELGNKSGIAFSLETIAGLAARQEQRERAARLWAASAALREAVGPPLPPKATEEHDHLVAVVRATLGEFAFSAAWEEGQAMTFEQAIEYALQDSPQDSSERPAEW